MEIYCPTCEWEPPSSATWTCECGHAWHTFDTQGQCPECGTVWRETQCHECHEWSPHHDWYHDLPPVDVNAIAEGNEAAPANRTHRRAQMHGPARGSGGSSAADAPTAQALRRVLP
jgi:hypothetical protein